MSGKKSLFFECASGISGDMTAAALLDLGGDRSALDKALESIPDKSFSVRISEVKRSGIRCMDFDVILDEEHENHDHDMAWLYGNMAGKDPMGGHEHSHEDVHHDEGGHHHEDPHHHHFVHRNLSDVLKIIDKTDMSENARAVAEETFRILARSESASHGVPVEEVHFHEVGAIDSIVDIVASSVLLDTLGVFDVIFTELTEGQGCVRCQHGILPIPVPAVLNIVTSYALPLHRVPFYGEYVTPTGAAFAAAVKTKDRLPEKYRVLKTGLGAGKREHELPGILRVMLIEEL